MARVGSDAESPDETAQTADRPRTLSAAYLEQAVDALHQAGDPAVLFRGNRERAESETAEAFQFLNAHSTHVTQCRNAVLFTALAAESYVNEFVAFYLKGEDYKAVDRMTPVVNRYVLGTKLACSEQIFTRGKEPIPTIARLFKLRNKLVHPKPGFGPAALSEPSGEFEEHFPTPKVAEFIVMVAAAAVILLKRAYGPESLDPYADVIWLGRDAILGYGRRATNVPKYDAESEPPLFGQAIDAFRSKRSDATEGGPG
jgi:hypothetical protein